MRRIMCAAGVLVLPAVLLVALRAPADAAACTIVGTPRDDVLRGTARADVICGRGGDDVLQGRGGDDVLRGGRGDDTLLPGRGANDVHGQDGNDTVRYDRLRSGHVSVDLVGGTVGGAVTDRLVGVENAVGTHRADSLVGNGASNRLSGRRGDDTITPGRGDDLAVGGLGSDTLDYSDLRALGGVAVDLGAGTVTGYSGTDTAPGFENAVGTPHGDKIVGTAEANVIDAGGGIDWLLPGVGDDRIQGGSGEYETALGDRDGDLLDYSGVTSSGVEVNLAAQTIGGPGGDGAVAGVERVLGTEQADVLIGHGWWNHLRGSGGDDTIAGGGYDDYLSGGAGDDALDPGPDAQLGDEWVSGDDGVDSVRFPHAQSGLVVTPASDREWDVSSVEFDIAYNRVTDVEVLFGTPFADEITGGRGATPVTFHGEGGADAIDTTDGHDGDAIHAPSGSGSTCVGDPGDAIDC